MLFPTLSAQPNIHSIQNTLISVVKLDVFWKTPHSSNHLKKVFFFTLLSFSSNILCFFLFFFFFFLFFIFLIFFLGFIYFTSIARARMLCESFSTFFPLAAIQHLIHSQSFLYVCCPPCSQNIARHQQLVIQCLGNFLKLPLGFGAILDLFVYALQELFYIGQMLLLLQSVQHH